MGVGNTEPISKLQSLVPGGQNLFEWFSLGDRDFVCVYNYNACPLLRFGMERNFDPKVFT